MAAAVTNAGRTRKVKQDRDVNRAMGTSTKLLGDESSIANWTAWTERLIRGQRVAIRTTIGNARWVGFCWYRRFVSAVPNTSMPASTAGAMSSPFFSLDQQRS